MKKLRGGIAVGFGSAVAVMGISALSATSAFAGTTSSYPVPSGWHFEITQLTVPTASKSVAAGSFIDVTVSVYEANPDVILSSGKPEDMHQMPATFPFKFVAGGQTVWETGVMSSSDVTPLGAQVPATGDMWTYKYKVPTPAAISAPSVTYSVYGGVGTPNTPEGSTTLPQGQTPYIDHYASNTYSSYSPSGALVQNQWVDGDDPIYGTEYDTVTLNQPPTGSLPEVPYAGALPAFFAAGAVFFYVRKRRRQSTNQ